MFLWFARTFLPISLETSALSRIGRAHPTVPLRSKIQPERTEKIIGLSGPVSDGRISEGVEKNGNGPTIYTKMDRAARGVTPSGGASRL